jgi:Domain of unknown function (DU1801)
MAGRKVVGRAVKKAVTKKVAAKTAKTANTAKKASQQPVKPATNKAAQNKTRETGASVAGYLAAIKDEGRRKDCEALAKLMSTVTGEPAKMWGAAIVGFGSVHYKYDSGREGDICLVGFSSRAKEISVYGTGSAPTREALLAKLGKHGVAKGCLYIARLADVDLAVLQQLIAASVKVKHSATG